MSEFTAKVSLSNGKLYLSVGAHTELARLALHQLKKQCEESGIEYTGATTTSDVEGLTHLSFGPPRNP